MSNKIEVAKHIGPIRIRVTASEKIKARVLTAPVSVRVVGTPGPQGVQGPVGPQGGVGPPGNLDAGIIVDGGNF